MVGSMRAAGRLSALLSLLPLRRLLAVHQPVALLLLLPFRWRAPPGAVVAAVVADAVASSASAVGGKKGKAVLLRVPVESPMAAARRQASARREIAVRLAGETRREYQLIPTPRGETLFTQCWWPHASFSAIKPRFDHLQSVGDEHPYLPTVMTWFDHLQSEKGERPRLLAVIIRAQEAAITYV